MYTKSNTLKSTLLLLVLSSVVLLAVITIIGPVSGGSANTTSVTTSSVDSTASGGATAMIGALCDYGQVAQQTFSDSPANSYNSLTPIWLGGATNPRVKLVHTNATVTTNATHTMTLSGGTATYPSVTGLALAGTLTTGVFDIENGAGTAANTVLQAGSIIPTQDNSIIVTALAFNNSDTVSINSGFNIQAQVAGTANHFGCAIATLVQTTATAVNPQWSWTNSQEAVATIAVFKPGAGGGAGGEPKRFLLLGAGGAH